MNKKYVRIWELSLPYQDARNDKGHAQDVAKFAKKLCDIENLNQDIVIVAAILHDIGWSQLSKKERFLVFNEKANRDEYLKVRIKHQEEGVKLAEKILKQVNYNPKFIKEILEIISKHDTREGTLSKNEAAVRDADKLNRCSKVGFYTDIRLSKITPKYYYKKLKERINNTEFLFLESSRKIALCELEERRKEFEGS